MRWLVGFFEWLWNSLKDLGSFLVGLPSLFIASVSTLLGAVAAVKSTVSAGCSYLNTVDSYGTAAVTQISSLFTNLHDIFSLVVYAFSLDFAFDVCVQLFTIFITLTVATLVFFFVAVPSFIVEWYAVKLTAFIISFIIPSGWNLTGLRVYLRSGKAFANMPRWFGRSD